MCVAAHILVNGYSLLLFVFGNGPPSPLLKEYCLEKQKCWDDGVPFVLFAVRETVQESLGFSPAQLIFGQTPHGPLQALQEKFLSCDTASTLVLDYVIEFRERLNVVISMARQTLSASQRAMKHRFDRRAVQREFQIGDKVLALLPVPGPTLSAKFSGPYEVCDRLSDTDYVIRTLEQRKKTGVVLKDYFSRELVTSGTALVVTSPVASSPEEDFVHHSSDLQTARLLNSEMLKVLPSRLEHLSPEHCNDILSLVARFAELFGDVPSQTSVLSHDIDAQPIKQHAYRVNSVKRTLLEQEAEYLLRHGFAWPSTSPLSSPCLYTAMAFGMCNTPATFQWHVISVLSGLSNCNAYLDELIMYTHSWEEHVQVLEQVFAHLASATLTLNLAKCAFGEATVTYVGQQQVRLVKGGPAQFPRHGRLLSQLLSKLLPCGSALNQFTESKS